LPTAAGAGILARTVDLARLSYDQVPSDATALLPIGSTEAHGPHLPLETDVLLAVEAARRAADRLGEPAVVLPALPYGVTDFAGEFSGTLGIRPETLEVLARDLVEAALLRYRAVAVVNLHFDPAHVDALRRAVEGLPRVAFPDLRRRRFAERLGAEFLSGACHAGSFETSLVLAHDAARVRMPFPPAHPVSLSEAIRRGVRTFGEAGLTRAYCGDPRAATAAEGDRLYDVIATILVDAIREVNP
jgi:creatinine amidohydrolase